MCASQNKFRLGKISQNLPAEDWEAMVKWLEQLLGEQENKRTREQGLNPSCPKAFFSSRV